MMNLNRSLYYHNNVRRGQNLWRNTILTIIKLTLPLLFLKPILRIIKQDVPENCVMYL